MTHRQLAFQAGLAVVALTAAYFTWQRGVDLAPGEVVVVDAGKSDIASVRFDDEEKGTFAELASLSDENGPFVAVHLSAQDKPGVGKTGVPTKLPERTVHGGDSAEKLLSSFAPLRASRGLGVLAETKLKDLGLAGSRKRITLALRTGKRTFAIAPAPPGGSDPYLRDEANGQVYVVSRSMLSDFQTAASSLIERHLHAFRLEEADRLVLAAGGARKDYRLSHDENGVHLSPSSAPDKPDTAAKTWHDRMFSLWPVEVLGKDETPSGGTPQVELRVDYSLRGRRLGFVEVAKLAAPAPVSSASEGAKNKFFARSERTLGWIELPVDSQHLLDDAKPFLR